MKGIEERRNRMFGKKTIWIAAIIAILIISVLIFCSVKFCLTELRYQFAYFFQSHHIVYNGEHYYFHGSEEDVDEGMYLLGDDIRVTLVDKTGKPYMAGRTELAYLYNNDPDAKYVYFDGGSWKKGEPPT